MLGIASVSAAAGGVMLAVLVHGMKSIKAIRVNFEIKAPFGDLAFPAYRSLVNETQRQG